MRRCTAFFKLRHVPWAFCTYRSGPKRCLTDMVPILTQRGGERLEKRSTIVMFQLNIAHNSIFLVTAQSRKSYLCIGVAYMDVSTNIRLIAHFVVGLEVSLEHGAKCGEAEVKAAECCVSVSSGTIEELHVADRMDAHDWEDSICGNMVDMFFQMMQETVRT